MPTRIVVLVYALDAHQIAGAALDVRVEEPVRAGDPLVDLRNMVIGYMQEVL